MVRRLPVIQNPSEAPPLGSGAAVLLGATGVLIGWMPLLWLGLSHGPAGIGFTFALAAAGGGALAAQRSTTARLKNAAISGALAAATVLAVGVLGAAETPAIAAALSALALFPLATLSALFGGWLATRLPTWRRHARTSVGKRPLP